MTSGGDAIKPDLDLDFTLTVEADSPLGVDEEALQRLTRFVLVSAQASGPWDITVALVDDARLQTLHREFMGLDTPTDIMTFPNENDGAHGGDLVISVDHARTQAEAWGLTPDDEVRFLVIHGMLHLLGWRDESEAQRQAMLDRQQALFDRWRAEG